MTVKNKELNVEFRLQKTKNRYLMVCAICSLLSAVFFLGCGYSIQNRASLPFKEIQIIGVENRTFEPKLQDRLYEALTEEFLQRGVKVTDRALCKLSGVINKFELRMLSEKEGVAVEYEIIVQGDFKFIDSTGRSKEIKNIGSPFIVSFYSRGQLDEVIALKELTSQKAMKHLAAEVVANIVYYF